MRIEKREATKWLKCRGCGEQVRDCEKYFQILDYAFRPVPGERYCLACEDIARENNGIDDNDNDNAGEERHLRRMETYAAYQYNGCTNQYWEDRDAGFCE